MCHKGLKRSTHIEIEVHNSLVGDMINVSYKYQSIQIVVGFARYHHTIKSLDILLVPF